jgi:hypothetical protein
LTSGGAVSRCDPAQPGRACHVRVSLPKKKKKARGALYGPHALNGNILLYFSSE